LAGSRRAPEFRAPVAVDVGRKQVEPEFGAAVAADVGLK
jgi:hypothetical protein